MKIQELFQDPQRTKSPRETGITHVLDKGLSVSAINDLMEVAAPYIDIVKMGWATAAVVKNLEAKLECYRKFGVDVCCGGTFFEVAFHRKKMEDYIAFLKDYDFKIIEISDGVLEMERQEKCDLIQRLSADFKVVSEVGSKDKEVVVAPFRWVENIKQELDAGAWKVIAEGRESGTIGLYRDSGEVRSGLIEEIQEKIDTQKIIFESPLKAQQVWMVKHFGLNVNLGNIAPEEVISLETIRQGLRADTFNGEGDSK